MYDFIGDIHGHADDLIQLLGRLGYEKKNGIFRRGDRKVIFLGDFIDRGPQIREVLQIVRAMVDHGSALAVMGNHEWNALAFHTKDVDAPGEYLRRHKTQNIHQHKQTLEQLNSDELAASLKWFRTLPMWMDLDSVRAVHACWDDRSMERIHEAMEQQGGLTDEILHLGCRPGRELFVPIEIVLKGKEAKLPPGVFFRDKEGNVRTETRVRWYLDPRNHTYRTYALADEIHSDLAIDENVIAQAAPYPANARPVFIGHYWLSHKRPELLADNVACLDFSVAKGGFLCAYRWKGEQKLTNGNFVWNDFG